MSDVSYKVPKLINSNALRVGFSRQIVLMVLDSNNVVKDLTGYTGRSQMRAQNATDEVRGEIVSEIDVDLTDAANGNVTLTISAADTTAAGPGVYLYDAWLKAPDDTYLFFLPDIAVIDIGVTEPGDPP